MINLEAVRVLFNSGTPHSYVALDDVNLSLQEGECVSVVGPNGAGKSTLINVLAGDVRAHSGRVFIDKNDVTDWPVYQRAPYVARVFQDSLVGTWGNLTLEENLLLASRRGHRRGLSFAFNKKEVAHLKSLVADLNMGLEDRFHQPMTLFSGGQRQTLSLLMATLQGCRVLLLDEHTSALDSATAKIVFDRTQSIVRQHRITSLMITHNLDHALAFGSKTIVMRASKIYRELSGKERDVLKPSDLFELIG
jgi:putative tryptophan/tyrosine transport system ATP-binding protein